ncbi:MAG: nucleotidyl transferase AbiEii/AbiGii toxin family protein [Oscillospiraceae bacterium]|nr:nucleotidyl transferase AbiEii/AbiGii toxin family protein [Oscillospiraceae bacterium]
MRIHTDTNAFSAIIELVNERTNIRVNVLEKDYYVTLMLKELSEWQDTFPIYFKGGTALYKAQGSIRRFSEDIDLTVCIDGCSNSQAKRRLEKAANGYKSLPRTGKKELESNQRGAITSLYDYQSISGEFLPDPLQRFGHVKVEATSFTVSEPFAPMQIASLIYDKADNEQMAVLRDEYRMAPFYINTIRLERIFVDKVFASEFYFQRHEYFEVSKHIYDLTLMMELTEIKELLANPIEMTAMMAFKRREEKARIGSDLSEKAISDFQLFDGIKVDNFLRNEFELMQNIYVFNEIDKISFEEVVKSLSEIQKSLRNEII